MNWFENEQQNNNLILMIKKSVISRNWRQEPTPPSTLWWMLGATLVSGWDPQAQYKDSWDLNSDCQQ